MSIFLRSTAAILVCLIVCLTLSKQGKDFSILLVICVSCAVLTAAISYLKPIIAFFRQLEDLGNLDTQLLNILMKAVGIGLLSETTALVCSDAGYAALGKVLKLLGSAIILWLSIPLLSALVELVQEILVAT